MNHREKMVQRKGKKMKRMQKENRKGTWTEQEDIILVNFVHLFGDRRWDFIAKVSGLNRTGKSCRLRWVNYLHPGLKREKMTPQEERLVLELHAIWGNRWSRIAGILPGRTDNEIKNCWRAHIRKKGQQKKQAVSPSSSSSPNCQHPSSSTIAPLDSLPFSATGKVSCSYDSTGARARGPNMSALAGKSSPEFENEKCYSMEDIWKDIDMSEQNKIMKPLPDSYSDEVCNFGYPSMASPSWEYSWDSLWNWNLDEEESKMCLSTTYQFVSCNEYGRPSLTG